MGVVVGARRIIKLHPLATANAQAQPFVELEFLLETMRGFCDQEYKKHQACNVPLHGAHGMAGEVGNLPAAPFVHKGPFLPEFNVSTQDCGGERPRVSFRRRFTAAAVRLVLASRSWRQGAQLRIPISPGSMRCDLRRLHLHGLLERIPNRVSMPRCYIARAQRSSANAPLMRIARLVVRRAGLGKFEENRTRELSP